MKRRITLIVVAVVLALCGVTYYWTTKRVSILDEDQILTRLPSATAQEVLEYYFWGVNHHNLKIVHACTPGRSLDNSYACIDRLEVLEIKEISPDPCLLKKKKSGQINETKRFRVKFRFHERYLKDEASMEDNKLYEWNFLMVRVNQDSPWQLADWGLG